MENSHLVLEPGLARLDGPGEFVRAEDPKLSQIPPQIQPKSGSSLAGPAIVPACVAELDRLVGLGAAVISPAGDPSHLGFVAVVLTDPEGGEFCVVGRPEHQPASNDSTDS